jgi:hypothetical protein
MAAPAFTVAVHQAQRKEGLWLAEHPFVQAVRNGSATPDDMRRWVRQIFCMTGTYGEVLQSLNPPPPVGVWLDPWRDLEMLARLARALGIPQGSLVASTPCVDARVLQSWFQHELTAPSRHIRAQACWALVEAMNPEVGACLAEGAARHLGLKPWDLGYLKIGMKSRSGADRYAARLLRQIPTWEWPSIRLQTLQVSRLMCRLYDSVVVARSRECCRAPLRNPAYLHNCLPRERMERTGRRWAHCAGS